MHTAVGVPWRRAARLIAGGAAAVLLLAGCGQGGGGSSADGAAAEGAECDNYPSEEVSLVVPYAAGGGFDAWARLMAPYLEKYLDGEGSVRVENIEGGGGMRAVNQVFAAEPDGTTILFTEPGFMSVTQVLGRAGDFDVRKLTYLGQTTVDPQVFTVAPDSDIDSIEDLAAEGKVIHAAQDISPIETITYDAYGVNADYVLHEGTSETVLAVRRGDADVTVTSLSSILEYMKSGDQKPILFLGTEEITPDLLGYDQLKGVETMSETGHPDLAEALEQFRVLAAPPGLPECIRTALADALQQTLSDEEFKSQAEEAGLRVIPAGADETQQRVEEAYETFKQYEDTLEAAVTE
jgi:tripartite-type tricarboxylate transporter receptor subunit TctC